MRILALNCGSSSLKYRLYELPGEQEIAGGEAGRLGPPRDEPGILHHHWEDQQITRTIENPDHKDAFREIRAVLDERPDTHPDAIGHRMVHGGTEFTTHTLVRDKTLAALHAIKDLAPLHNPPALNLLEVCREHYPELPQTVIFDTVFHATIPEEARIYAIPKELRETDALRKYGFHGISHEFVSREAARFMDVDPSELNAVSCHLGTGGASLCAIRNGKSIDNTMGYSPLQGLMMSTRSGDLDPAIVLRLLSNYNTDVSKVEHLLNRESGVLGMSGTAADIREIFRSLENRAIGNKQMELTASTYLWRIHKYLGAYLLAAAPAQAIIFTDTVGETMPAVRHSLCSGLEAFGVKLDAIRNSRVKEYPFDIASDESQVRILVISTNEELAIAQITAQLLTRKPETVA